MPDFNSQTQLLGIDNQAKKRKVHMWLHDNSDFSISLDKVSQKVLFNK